MIPQVLLVQLEVVESDLPLWKREDAFTNSGGVGDRVEPSKRDFLRVSYSIGQKQSDGHCPNAGKTRREAHDSGNVGPPFETPAPAAGDVVYLPVLRADHPPPPSPPPAGGPPFSPAPPHRHQHHEYQEGQPAKVKEQ